MTNRALSEYTDKEIVEELGRRLQRIDPQATVTMEEVDEHRRGVLRPFQRIRVFGDGQSFFTQFLFEPIDGSLFVAVSADEPPDDE